MRSRRRRADSSRRRPEVPELPEVEVLRRQLEKEYVGKRIRAVEVKTRQYVKEARPSAKRVTKAR